MRLLLFTFFGTKTTRRTILSPGIRRTPGSRERANIYWGTFLWKPDWLMHRTGTNKHICTAGSQMKGRSSESKGSLLMNATCTRGWETRSTTGLEWGQKVLLTFGGLSPSPSHAKEREPCTRLKGCEQLHKTTITIKNNKTKSVINRFKRQNQFQGGSSTFKN